MTRLRLALVLVVLATTLRARAGEEIGPATFVFAKPGQTTIDQVKKLLREPTEEYDGEVLGTTIDPAIARRNPKTHRALLLRSLNEKKPITLAHVLVYRDATDPAVAGMLVFRDKTLWYWVGPVSPSENDPKKLEERWGSTPRVVTEHVVEGDLAFDRTTWIFAAEGFAYIRDLKPEITLKVAFPPREP